ncbi:hypothetical protein EN962_10780 [Mesorhizobium sp. M7A.F.Ca.CA.001.09.2.1]|nr:hypothetical protein EN965_13515 [Mesorhizobium sp. M7A.F.Ca.CA.001.05.1.1]RUY72058.1 hypothetical protein EN980_04090 [Mesorhizobium sp. M7A.F.Ca.CA.001.13.1.1]RUY78982.1 hypothetical protein EN962_10780 [Mesorhizobium sp. M7A.F.Ca.CA.001.09.2.1]RUZ86419.1 hypothetical protein EN942_11795 [Mesorhizobium sp. M7A.F.Ca.CA.001.14.1.1]RVA84241.1 hypothetical protein EN914_03800 [Mesorhizobium sp. M7A.F.Ca.CA.001.08.2.1]RVB58123.1 hypothetical protein EN898_01285 [Mesorhizobium sp. M7A.F.Ca.CA.0
MRVITARVHPPLSCRTSPRGRLAACAPRPSVIIEDWRSHMRHPISPLEGEMSGRTEGGAKELGISELASGAVSS